MTRPIYLNLGTGLSAAIVVGGQVLSGSNGAAGEIGYNLRAAADVGVPLAARIMLEDMVSGQALARRAAGHTPHGGPMEAAEVFEASRDVPGLDRLVTDFVSELSFHVVNLAICHQPSADRGRWRHGPILGPPAAGPGASPQRRCTVPAGARRCPSSLPMRR